MYANQRLGFPSAKQFCFHPLLDIQEIRLKLKIPSEPLRRLEAKEKFLSTAYD